MAKTPAKKKAPAKKQVAKKAPAEPPTTRKQWAASIREAYAATEQRAAA